jgi:hypothetical protein
MYPEGVYIPEGEPPTRLELLDVYILDIYIRQLAVQLPTAVPKGNVVTPFGVAKQR